MQVDSEQWGASRLHHIWVIPSTGSSEWGPLVRDIGTIQNVTVRMADVAGNPPEV